MDSEFEQQRKAVIEAAIEQQTQSNRTTANTAALKQVGCHIGTRALHGPGGPIRPGRKKFWHKLGWAGLSGYRAGPPADSPSLLAAAHRTHWHFRHHPVSMACVIVTVYLQWPIMCYCCWALAEMHRLYHRLPHVSSSNDTFPSTSRLSRHRGHGVSGRSNHKVLSHLDSGDRYIKHCLFQ